MLEQPDIHIWKKEIGSLPHIIRKFKSKSIIHLNVRAKIIKHLEENIRINLHDLRVSSGFLDMIPNVQMAKENRWVGFL